MSQNTYIGIDPGWKNLGLAIISQDPESKLVKPIKTMVMNPSGFKTITCFLDNLDEIVTPLTQNLCGVTIERFVAYGQIHTAESEDICMLIGGLRYYFGGTRLWNKEPRLVRAIEWKTELVKALFKKKGFENPSETLDKKFSVAAAKACLDEATDFKTDHEGDAVCLAALPIFTNKGN